MAEWDTHPVLDDTRLSDWCRRSLGSRPARVLFRTGHLSQVVAAELSDGRAPGQAATVAQSADFIAGYQAAAGLEWTERETQDAWAAGLWVRLFNAKKDAAEGGGPQLDRLADEADQRLFLAGIGHSG